MNNPLLTMAKWLKETLYAELDRVYAFVQADIDVRFVRIEEYIKSLRNGVDGRDGKDGTNGRDGEDGLDGRDGADGMDGMDGRDGKDGKSIEVRVDATRVGFRQEGTARWLYTQSLVGNDGKDGRDGNDGRNGRDGKDGKDGADGSDGRTPDHEWAGTLLRFEKPDGSWGQWVNVAASVGLRGSKGAGAGTFDLNTLPEYVPDVAIEELIIRQDGVWRRIPYDVFKTLVQPVEYTDFRSETEDGLSHEDYEVVTQQNPDEHEQLLVVRNDNGI